MSNYYSIAVIDKQKVIGLGKISGAVFTFPFIINSLEDTLEVVLYGDESHAFLEDRYEYDSNFEIVCLDGLPFSEEVAGLEVADFEKVFDEISGMKIQIKQLKAMILV